MRRAHSSFSASRISAARIIIRASSAMCFESGSGELKLLLNLLCGKRFKALQQLTSCRVYGCDGHGFLSPYPILPTCGILEKSPDSGLTTIPLLAAVPIDSKGFDNGSTL